MEVREFRGWFRFEVTYQEPRAYRKILVRLKTLFEAKETLTSSASPGDQSGLTLHDVRSALSLDQYDRTYPHQKRYARGDDAELGIGAGEEEASGHERDGEDGVHRRW